MPKYKAEFPPRKCIRSTTVLVIINDLPSLIESYVQIFADDTKLFSAIKDEYGSEILQNDLYRLDEWSRTWQINFSISKCKVLHLGKKNQQ